MPSYYNPRRQSSGNLPIVFGVVLLLLVGIGAAVYFATRGTEASREVQTKGDSISKTDAQLVTPPNSVKNNQKSEPPPNLPKNDLKPRPTIKTDGNAKPADDNDWKAEAITEYLEAFKENQRKMSEMKIRIGMLSEAEFANATRCLKILNETENSLKLVPDGLADAAAKIAPDYVAALRREKRMRTPEYDKLVKDGLLPKRYPIEKRMKLYSEFSRVVGTETKWSLMVGFDQLSADEMDEMMLATDQLSRGGLGSLTKRQRQLLLKAEAHELFKRELGL